MYLCDVRLEDGQLLAVLLNDVNRYDAGLHGVPGPSHDLLHHLPLTLPGYGHRSGIKRGYIFYWDSHYYFGGF